MVSGGPGGSPIQNMNTLKENGANGVEVNRSGDLQKKRSAETIKNDKKASANVRKTADKLWEKPGFKQAAEYGDLDLFTDTKHYLDRKNPSGGEILKDFTIGGAATLPVAGVLGKGAPKVGKAAAAKFEPAATKAASKLGSATRSAGKALKSGGKSPGNVAKAGEASTKGAASASKGSKLMSAAKRAPTFLSGAQFASTAGGGSGGGTQQQPYVDPYAGVRV